MTSDKALCAETDLGQDGAPDWVQLLPAGLIRGRDGRTFRLGDGAAVVDASRAGNIDLPIDYEHQVDAPAARKNGPVPAAGWIKELELRADGIWGRVEWTETARNMITAREYRFLSPVILHSARDGTVTRLIGVSLVHRPNLALKALSSEEPSMPDPATQALATIAAALGLSACASPEQIVTAINDARHPDPGKYVPVSAVAALLRERNDHIAMMGQKDAAVRVDEAMHKGYITPAMRDWAVALCAQNPESFDAFVASATPAYAHLFARRDWTPPEKRSGAASAEERAICDQLGLEPSALR